jgi:hypothetical protein
VPVNIELFDDLDEVERSAGGELDRDRQACLFDRLIFYRLIADHCPPPGKLVVLRGGEGERRAWLFLAVAGRKARAFTAWYSLRFGVAGAAEADVMTAMAAALRDGAIAEVELAPLADPDLLRRAFEQAGWHVSVVPRTGNWQAMTAGMDFDTFWASRPGRLRNTAKRRAKGVSLDIGIHEQFSETAWADYEAVYRSSWKPEEGSFPFLRSLVEQEGAAGTLRLGIAKLDDVPVAAQLWLVEKKKATIHKLAYAESAKSLSPGTLLSVAMFRHVLDKDHVEQIDYGTGDEPYKADWMDQRRQLWQLNAFNPRTLQGLASSAKARVSALVRRMRSR